MVDVIKQINSGVDRTNLIKEYISEEIGMFCVFLT